jgi:hypothetical protein
LFNESGLPAEDSSAARAEATSFFDARRGQRLYGIHIKARALLVNFAILAGLAAWRETSLSLAIRWDRAKQAKYARSGKGARR